jgi:tetratricopeptide (TPR) repeat protein
MENKMEHAGEGSNVERAEPGPDVISKIQGSISAINETISTLQKTSAKVERPWFQQPALIISLLALLFSFGTTTASYFRTKQLDIHDARSELRTLILRLNQLPRENVELSKKYEGDYQTINGLSGMLNAENALVAKQAADVMERIPTYVGATEYLSVAYALSQSNLTGPALKLIKLASAASNDLNDEVAVLRFYGQLLFGSGDLEGGREKFKTALALFSKYPTANQNYVQMTHLLTELYWAQAEATARQCQYAKLHIAEARTHLALLAPGPPAKGFEDQINQAMPLVQGCVS